MKLAPFAFIGLLLLTVSCFQSCEDKEGCTDPKASNYNAEALDDDGTCTFDKTDDIVEIAIRQVKTGQESAFETARANFISLLTQQDYVYNDREYGSFYHFNPAQDTARQVFIGMTQYEDLETFQEVGNELGASAEAAAFFSTFDMLAFTAMKPIKAGTAVELTQVARSGQILEVAVRDLSLYSNFDQADYEAKRDAFLAVLAQQPGRVAEYQWQSVLDPNLVIGMTVYESQQAFFQIGSNPEFLGNPDVVAFFTAYPPTMGARFVP
ncbi:MAG: hypothetical protein IPL49_02150 [Saprospirales bacterium]|nr:hypothetical protein [Saprospirales bacterium]